MTARQARNTVREPPSRHDADAHRGVASAVGIGEACTVTSHPRSPVTVVRAGHGPSAAHGPGAWLRLRGSIRVMLGFFVA